METKKVKQQNLLTFFSRDKDNIQEKDGDSAESLPSTSASSLGETHKNKYVDTSECKIQTKKRKGDYVRHYNKEYLKLGFIIAPGNELSPRPLCVVCSEIMSNEL